MSMQFVDTHAHLCSEAFATDQDQVVAAARQAGVQWIVNVADDLPSSEAALQLAVATSHLYGTVGVHPHEAGCWNQETEQRLRQLLATFQAVAVGEIGLDYHYDFTPRELQIEAFRAQLQLAKEFALPVVVHNREADKDALPLLEQAAPLKGVMHCFWSDAATARQALDQGLYLGVGGPITFGNTDDLRAVLKEVPLERLVLETDAPYLAPKPYRGRRNEPALVVKVAEALAALHDRSLAYVARQTSENAQQLFLG